MARILASLERVQGAEIAFADSAFEVSFPSFRNLERVGMGDCAVQYSFSYILYAGTTETTLQTHLLQSNLLVIHRLSLGVGGCRFGILQPVLHTVFDAEQHDHS